MFSIRKLRKKDAVEICGWRYDAPYDVYDYPDWKKIKRDGWGISRWLTRRAEFYAVTADTRLCGFFRLVDCGDHIMLGLGLRPDLCGRGLGQELVSLALDTARSLYGGMPVRLDVRDFNLRARKCYERMGFREIDRYADTVLTDTVTFILMERR